MVWSIINRHPPPKQCSLGAVHGANLDKSQENNFPFSSVTHIGSSFIRVGECLSIHGHFGVQVTLHLVIDEDGSVFHGSSQKTNQGSCLLCSALTSASIITRIWYYYVVGEVKHEAMEWADLQDPPFLIVSDNMIRSASPRAPWLSV